MKPKRGLVRRALRRIGQLLLVVLGVVLVRVVLGWILYEPTPEAAMDDAQRQRALALHERAIVLDGHNDVPTWITDFDFDIGMDGAEESDSVPILSFLAPALFGRPPGDEVRTATDLDRARAGGLDAQFFSIWVACEHLDPERPGAAADRARLVMDKLEASVARHPDRIAMAKSVAELRAVTESGRLAALMGLEGGHAIEDNLETLREFYDRGVRYVTLTHTCSHTWADASTDAPRHGGLTDFGREVVRTMNRLGMIVDISHVSDDTFWDAIEESSAPIMASHSSARALAEHPRNMTDDMLVAVANNGGVVMVNFLANYIDARKTSLPSLVTGWFWLTHPRGTQTPLTVAVDHIDHIVEVAGIDHVGLGSDFDGGPFFPEGLDTVDDFPNITLELVRRGYTDEDIEKILGGNAIRVWRDVEAAAAAAAPP